MPSDPSSSRDAFDQLGLPPRFRIDAAALQRAYLAKSALAHPDLAEEVDAAAESAAINRARQQLEDPESRADLLLTRLGGPSRDADRSLPDGFLAQIMSLREELQEAQAAEDAAAAEKLDDWARDRRSRHIADVTARFDALANPPAAGELKEIRRQLNAWRYIERMLEQIRGG